MVAEVNGRLVSVQVDKQGASYRIFHGGTELDVMVVTPNVVLWIVMASAAISLRRVYSWMPISRRYLLFASSASTDRGQENSAADAQVVSLDAFRKK